MELDIRLASKEINEILWRTHKTISTAESCTSGKIASILTIAPGASAYFKGGVITYADEMKTAMLEIDADLIAEKTAVYKKETHGMVEGANRLFSTDYAVAATGFAGPGGPDAKTGIRVGTIWVAAGREGHILTRCLTDDEGRDHNILKASAAAVHLLLEILKADAADEDADADIATF